MVRVSTLVLTACLILSGPCPVSGQDRFDAISRLLESAMVDQPGLDESVELSVDGVSLQEFVRALGQGHRLNISIDPNVKGQVVNNFSDARVADVLLYLCKNYDLDVELIGSIIALRTYVAPVVVIPPPAPRPPRIVYHEDSSKVDMDLQRDRLDSVAMVFSSATGRNVVLAPGLHERRVSVFLRNNALDAAMDNLAYSNGLIVKRSPEGAYMLDTPSELKTGTQSGKTRSPIPDQGEMQFEVSAEGLLNLQVTDMPLTTLIEQVSKAMGVQYFLHGEPDKMITARLTGVDYAMFLDRVLRGTDFTHEETSGVHVIGKRDLEGLRATELVRLENRTVTDVLGVIPDAIKKEVVIQEFKELNGIILSGSRPRIEEIRSFLRQIDQLVPMVTIEVLIVDVKRSRSITTGINAGIGGAGKPQQSGGTLSPGVDYNLTSSSINSLINSFNGFGVFNLGNVTPDFYLSIQALETDGTLKLRSTPQLSTLNGHEATLSIGATEYYLEVRNDIIGSQNPTVATSQVYKPINADLSLKILPMVSSDEVVTLEIEVNQSAFTERISNTAPPGSEVRKFKSIIRVKNREMVVLGGLEEKENNKSGRGLPLLSRIPVLKWIFGSRTSSSGRNKLTIFIRPTVIYGP